jgi:hypothetical protein
VELDVLGVVVGVELLRVLLRRCASAPLSVPYLIAGWLLLLKWSVRMDPVAGIRAAFQRCRKAFSSGVTKSVRSTGLGN